MTESTKSLLMNTDQAAALLGIGRTLFYSMHSNGRLGPRPIRLGRRTFWHPEELKQWVNAGCPPRRKWTKK